MERTLPTRIAELERRRSQIEAEIGSIKARNNDQERRRDTRRKILVGAGVIVLANESTGFRAWLLASLKPKTASRDWALVEEALSGPKEQE